VRLAYDLVYNPLETRFLREARIAGCETLGGLDMLVGQAIEQFKLWTDQQPDGGIMRDAAERALGMK
jgi:shikimate 5-dehydrogenase